MVDAPKKIWARPDPATVYMDGSSPLMARDREFRDAVEYVRADMAERQLAEARALFDECAVARDTAGFIGTVPECIEALDGEVELLTERNQHVCGDRDRLAAELERLREALTPSGATKAAYIGEFSETIVTGNPNFGDDDDEPETITTRIPVSWTTIKEIMEAILARAGSASLEDRA